MEIFFILIISLSVAVMVIYAAALLIQLKRTTAAVAVFVDGIDKTLAPLLRETTALSGRINNMAAEVAGWFAVKNQVMTSVQNLAAIITACKTILPAGRGTSGTKSAFSLIINLLRDLIRTRSL